ncbi:bifunctional UDP-N-acetylglucosamine diphosphorylase/glucosamine-1-phosphate N-acetyltransferase GlmU [Hyphomonas sp. WL0036]|uniref:bifunctional UDP-N-acetylglucosamine diphosphorylase/glucosamine-1-phosphate N-acetyltransferase GlmU n=1 Tax=Hyphomonas sediminis TaxID=2866160 RepID=UPI001C80BCB3|nr:bifunctional UDP-N-acetylglucosamine diphosphorylase/glucosamine-1-phosphate N-acetyltransferase GlmU [Hyphomonas sediminis]MBY9065332.1 bifunctional UDP-N-acetylglucosamine diphosphorylase/glucosamine-1-phosphate N-acetyltransferase GlmU [Hyphomonas sediminis]
MTQGQRQRAAVILAAGKGTRMKSPLPKVMHAVAGRPMVDWSIELARTVGAARIVAVVHPSQDVLIAHLQKHHADVAIAFQDPPQGTGHAVRCAEGALAGFEGDLAVLYGDSPLVPAATIEGLFATLSETTGLGVLGFEADEPGLYGRLITGADGSLEAIVEAREASPEQLQVRLCNSGVMAGRAKDMFRLLANVTNNNAKGEYYLTDLVGLARAERIRCAAAVSGEDDLIGCDSKADLAEAEAIFQRRRRRALMDAGVTMVAPETVFLSHDTEIGADAVIEPNVVFGPGVRVAGGAQIRAFSHLEGAVVGEGCSVGPYARLRPGTVLAANVHIGNFVETKNTEMGEGAKANHLAYLGDGSIGAGANIGAGTIFCNYDGFFKHHTEVGEGAFVGSNSSLVAPVKIGDGAYIGSGSVITKDVAADALAVARGRQMEREGWGAEFRTKKAAEKAARGSGKDKKG